jgi:RNA polymerase sigma factor (sigma-70 family)
MIRSWRLAGRKGTTVAVCSARQALDHEPVGTDIPLTTDPAELTALTTTPRPGPVTVYASDDTFVVLAVIWDTLMTRENVGAYAWALLKTRVADELALQGREPAAVETLAFERAVRAATAPILDDFRTLFRSDYDLADFEGQVTELADSMRLFAAIARLPERQFDVMVLHYALGFDTRTTALVMGIKETTVRSTRRTAKLRLAQDLVLPLGGLTDEE